ASPAEHLGVGGSDLRHVSTFTRVPSPHPVIEAGNGDRASAVVQPADHFAECLQGIADDSAEDPGMKLAVCASRFDLDAEASPKRIGDCGPARAGDLHVGNDGAIRREFVSAPVEERGETWAADLLLALEETDDIHGQRA